jgi:hypothetical protein
LASLADILDAEMPAAAPSKPSGTADPDGLFARANGIETIAVLDRLGIPHNDTPRGEMARCPGCSEDGALVCKNGGIKCLHDRCSTSGPTKNRGFRTNVDIVATVQNVDPSVAAKTICGWFGIEVPAGKARPVPQPPPGRFDDDEPMREPGDDSDEPRGPPAAQQQAKGDAPRILTVREILSASMLRAFDRTEQKSCTSGNYRIDDITGGMKPGFVWVFGADTGFGKSSWLVMVADENIRHRKRVLIVSAEDDERLYGDRLIARRARISADNIRRRKFTPSEYSRFTEVVNAGEDVPVFFDARGKSAEWIARKTKTLIAEHGIDLVAFDYLQALDNERHQQDRRNQVTYIARTLTDAVKTSGVAGVIFSQITVQMGKPIPDKHSIKESRDVANAAEVVILGFIPQADVYDRPAKDNEPPPKKIAGANERTIVLEKVKDGPAGAMIHLPWYSSSACFDTVLDPEQVLRDQQEKEFSKMTDDFAERYP